MSLKPSKQAWVVGIVIPNLEDLGTVNRVTGYHFFSHMPTVDFPNGPTIATRRAEQEVGPTVAAPTSTSGVPAPCGTHSQVGRSIASTSLGGQ